jgi:2-succinyl-5-enolpyruvyl-6-hydroxy-3-cyclohexene-1-carboxylate synthase
VRRGLAEDELDRIAADLAQERVVVVAGVRTALDPVDAVAVHRLAAHLGWPVVADAPSGCRLGVPGDVLHADALLRDPGFAAEHRPRAALRIGGLLTSKALNRWLATSGAFQVGLDRYG